jgi:hypothetical protein
VDETEKERLDRELIELLNELRVALPGVQVLFAFLLILPFQQRFADATDFERGLFAIAFLAAATSSVLFIAPSSYHRLRFRDGDKLRMLTTSNRLMIAGMIAMGISMAAVSFLVIEFLFGDMLGAFAAAAIVALVAIFWYGIPLTRKLKDGGPAR